MKIRKKWLDDISMWVKQNEELDSDSLEMGAQHAWQKPWMNTVTTGRDTYDYANPPGEIYEAILEGLLSIYDSWGQQLASYNEKYDLKIWIFLPEFIRSIVSVTQRDVTKYNEEELIKSNRDFSIKMFPGLQGELAEYEFQGYHHYEHFYASEFGDCLYWGYKFEEEPPSKEYMQKEMARLGAVHENVILENGMEDIRYSVRKGNLWIGTRKE